MEDFNQGVFFGELRSLMSKNNSVANLDLVALLKTCPDPHFLKHQVIPYCADKIAAGAEPNVRVTLETIVQLEEILKNPCRPLITTLILSEAPVVAALMTHLEACVPEDFPFPYLQSISLKGDMRWGSESVSGLTEHAIPLLNDITLHQGINALGLTCVRQHKWPNLKIVRLRGFSHKEKQIVSRALSEQGMRVHVS